MLVPCPDCKRHVKQAEACPFCATSTLRSSSLGAAVLAAAMTVAACAGDNKGTLTPPPDPTAPTATATGTTPTAAPTTTASTSPTTTTTTTAPQPDRAAAPRYGMPPAPMTPIAPPKH